MAAPTTRIQVRGAKQLSRALKKAGVQIKDLKDANQRVADVVARTATPLTPRATGRLAGSIRSARQQSAAVVRAGGGSIRYARFVEYGTSKMPARSYLYRAAGDSHDQWMDVYYTELQRLMDQVAARSPGTGE
jgi:HK97 gp10 family phage protein